MASRATSERWLHQLTHLPTAPGLEQAVVDWVEEWVRRRDDLRSQRDSGGNLLVSQRDDGERAPVLAVAHMDHPAFVITDVRKGAGSATFEFRGAVTSPYFESARVQVVSRPDGASGEIRSYDDGRQTGSIVFDAGAAEPGDIATWMFADPEMPVGRFRAPACDDLAGVAASLAALDLARRRPDLANFGVLLTRAEEIGLIGAIHAAKQGTIPADGRLLSIETSRELPDARIGDGPVIRVGDRSTVFDATLTNRISHAAEIAGIQHQRKLMSGGRCEATAFGVFGLPATGLCVPLGNYHNRGNLAEVEAGHGEAVAMLEEISLDDFHGLVDLLLLAAEAVDREDPLRGHLDELYESKRQVLGATDEH